MKSNLSFVYVMKPIIKIQIQEASLSLDQPWIIQIQQNRIWIPIRFLSDRSSIFENFADGYRL